MHRRVRGIWREGGRQGGRERRREGRRVEREKGGERGRERLRHGDAIPLLSVSKELRIGKN